jgi:hypothetical protein
MGERELDEASGKNSGFSVFLLAFVAVLLLYVLSIGPVVKFASKNGINRNTLVTFYRPVIWLHDHTFLKKPLEAYVELWGVK